jgi:hypothetical protein
MLEDVMEKLRNQLARYQKMAREEREHTGGETYGTCAYLQGAIVATRNALDVVRRANGGED